MYVIGLIELSGFNVIASVHGVCLPLDELWQGRSLRGSVVCDRYMVHNYLTSKKKKVSMQS